MMHKKFLLPLLGCALLGAAAISQAQTAPSTPAAAPAPTAPAAAAPAATAPERQAGFVKSVRGDVKLLSAAAATARNAVPGDALASVDRIVTGPDSSAAVVLRDDTTLVVGPSSRLDLKQFHFDATTHEGGLLVSLLRGSMRMITGLIGKTNPDAVRVETQTATIGIRGTDFIVQTDGQP
ncbi:FecR domain-containing protein [Variovorax sp. PDC80]|uniref:FecR family protein n=1 Tax=Variovorax sp. PDC80 TaxID=1882827 RepID=UPI00210948DF|nr:FecR family protein [Variovorax sp. PDC80]